MAGNFSIRASKPSDLEGLEQLYGLAFPDQDLIPLLRDLLNSKDSVVLTNVATCERKLVGHIAFTLCLVSDSDAPLYLLGPLAVAPEFQGQGVGSQLVRSGLELLHRKGAQCVLVLGDPAYYTRFGFQQEDRILAPHDLPEQWIAAWQSVSLCSEIGLHSGRLKVPKPWQPQALWLP